MRRGIASSCLRQGADKDMLREAENVAGSDTQTEALLDVSEAARLA